MNAEEWADRHYQFPDDPNSVRRDQTQQTERRSIAHQRAPLVSIALRECSHHFLSALLHLLPVNPAADPLRIEFFLF